MSNPWEIVRRGELKYYILNVLHLGMEKARYAIGGIKCWLSGHVMRGESVNAGDVSYTLSTWCEQCGRDGSDYINGYWRGVLWQIPHRVYVWCVRREWKLFDRFDCWLLENHCKRLPAWWEY